jgi:hypothetical protein
MQTQHTCIQLDEEKKWKGVCSKLSDVQRIQAAKQAIKIRKLLSDKKAGKSYGSGINSPSLNMNINTVEIFSTV